MEFIPSLEDKEDQPPSRLAPYFERACLRSARLPHQLINRRHYYSRRPGPPMFAANRDTAKPLRYAGVPRRSREYFFSRTSRAVLRTAAGLSSFGRSHGLKLLGRSLRLRGGRFQSLGINPHFRFLVRMEARAGRDQVPQDDVFLESHQVVHLAGQGRLREHLGGFLEAGGRNETLRLNGRLGDAEQLNAAGGGRGRHEGRWFTIVRLQPG